MVLKNINNKLATKQNVLKENKYEYKKYFYY